MNRPERFESNDVAVEALNTPEAIEASETADRVIDSTKVVLQERHSDKPYHDPDHSVSEIGKEEFDSVTGRVRTFSRSFKESFVGSLGGTTPEEADKKALFFRGVEVGAAVHDRVIRFKVENGKVIRFRGEIEPGGNEYDSFKEGEQELLANIENKNNPFLPYLITVMRQTVEGTYPGFAFVEIDQTLVASFPANVRACLEANDAEGNRVYKGLRIDSAYSNESLAALLSSTSDLGDVFTSKKFQFSGNQEFFEGEIGVVEDCLAYQNGAPIPRARGKQILDQMKGWRKTQVGMALNQKIRLMEKYTQENLSSLFSKEFGNVPDPEEVNDFLETMQPLIDKIDHTVMDAADIHDDFVAQFDSIPADGPEYFTEAEQTTFLQAVAFMDGDPVELEKYAQHVEREQERPPEELKLAA